MRYVSHAYVIEGDAGLLDNANAFAKTLNCLENGETACGACVSCRVFASGNHPDTLYVTGTKATSIGVDDVREQIIEQMATKPFHYKYKVFIINKAETLTPAAQNALLKTIEEPAPYGVFLLLTKNIEAMLETVLSRCTVMKEKPLADGGTPFLSDNPEMADLARKVIDTAHTLDIVDAMMLYKSFEPYKESKESAQALLDMLYTGFGKKIREAPARQQTAVKAITQTKEILSQNGNFQLAIELMLLKINGKIPV
jgi:DNA polymerase III delta prime subunit